MARKKKVENAESVESVESVESEVQHLDTESSKVDEEQLKNQDGISNDEEMLSETGKDTTPPVNEGDVQKELTPVDEVPIRDLPGFEKGSRLDPNNPHDVLYARQQLRKLRSKL